MGNGKTTLVEEGISKILDRPFAHISLGGATDASFLEGFSFTYEGSTYGKIADILIKCKCMNPIIYFDELDKVSETQKGDEIVNILMHLIDPSQNQYFQDKFFSGIDIDMSKCTFVFSYNDPSLINPILRDRITEINTKGFKAHEKIKICNDYLLPKILVDVGFQENSIYFADDIIKFIIDNYTLEGGVRKLKEKLYEIVRELNLRYIRNECIAKVPLEFPLTITMSMIMDIFKNYQTITPEKIHFHNQIGKINGLYATMNDTGGIIPIESLDLPTSNKLDLNLTGNQGKTMRESMEVARTVAWNILPSEIKKEKKNDWETNGVGGLHMHCPEGATPKDGPSAGTAITVAIVSRLTGIPIYNTVGITGEMDLSGNVLEIGGLEHKLHGAKKAGVTKVLISEQNRKDYNKIKVEYPDLIDKHFTVIVIKNIWDALKHSLVKNNLRFENHTTVTPQPKK